MVDVYERLRLLYLEAYPMRSVLGSRRCGMGIGPVALFGLNHTARAENTEIGSALQIQASSCLLLDTNTGLARNPGALKDRRAGH